MYSGLRTNLPKHVMAYLEVCREMIDVDSNLDWFLSTLVMHIGMWLFDFRCIYICRPESDCNLT